MDTTSTNGSPSNTIPGSPSGTSSNTSNTPLSQPPTTPSSPAPIPVSVSPPSSLPHNKKNMYPAPLIILILIGFFLGGLLLAAWYFQLQFKKETQSSQPAQASQNTAPLQEITIGTDATFQPMEYRDKQGELIGYDIDLGNKIGQELGVKVTYKNIPWTNLFKALSEKKVDMIISSVTITDDRKKDYNFSTYYLNAGQVIITKKQTATISKTEDLKDKKVAVQQATTSETEALKYTTDKNVLRFSDLIQATTAVENGTADAVLVDLPAAKEVMTTNPTLKIASDPFTNDYYAVVFRKGDANVKKINAVLSSLEIKGVLVDLKQKWLD